MVTRKRLLAAAGLVAAFGLAIWAFVIEPSSLTTQQYDLAIPRWSKDLDGLRVAVLADLHVGSPFNGMSKLRRIVELTNSLKPDLILTRAISLSMASLAAVSLHPRKLPSNWGG